MWETWVQSLGWEDPLEKEMATHSSTLAWKIPWTEEPGRLQSMGSQRVWHDWVTSLSFFFFLLQMSRWRPSGPSGKFQLTGVSDPKDWDQLHLWLKVPQMGHFLMTSTSHSVTSNGLSWPLQPEWTCLGPQSYPGLVTFLQSPRASSPPSLPPSPPCSGSV